MKTWRVVLEYGLGDPRLDLAILCFAEQGAWVVRVSIAGYHSGPDELHNTLDSLYPVINSPQWGPLDS